MNPATDIKKKILRLNSLLIVFAVVFTSVFPLYWAANTSFKTRNEIFSQEQTFFPKTFIFSNYIEVFEGRKFERNILNSVIIAGGTTIFSLSVGLFCAYALARLKFRGKYFVLSAILVVSMFPQISILSPLFILLRNLRLLNTYGGLILPYTTFSLPLTIWLLTNYFREIPFGLEEAARIDGASYYQILSRIILPLAVPGLVTSGMLVFIQTWNEFLFALAFTITDKTKTIPVAIAHFQGQYETPWGTLMAATVIVTLPLIILVLFMQKRIVSGLTAGGIKE